MLLALNQFLPSSTPGFGYGTFQREWQTHANLSGVTLSQNASPTGIVSLASTDFQYQVFSIPSNYARGEGAQTRIPAITGFQVLTIVAQGYAPYASCEYTLDSLDVDENNTWNNIAQGIAIGSHIDGSQVWFDVIFDQPVEIEQDELIQDNVGFLKTDTDLILRIGVRGRTIQNPTTNLVVPYDDVKHTVLVNGHYIDVNPLVPFLTTPVLDGTDPGFVVLDTDANQVTFSHQYGLDYIWYTTPNPLSGGQAYTGTNPITDASYGFRLLSDSADEGVDHLGNRYRSTVVRNQADSLTTFDTQLQDFNYWLSKPNPSKFAVENLYFDVSVDNHADPSVIDRIMVDPVTSGVWFNVYYSMEGSPATSVSEWENKLWTPVPQSFRMTKKETHILPKPITAKYICLEFSHLQAQPYDPGQFAPDQIYKKFPSWVQNYFTSKDLRLTEDNFIGQNINVVYDLLSFAYQAYTADLLPLPLYIGDDLDAPLSIFHTDSNGQANGLSLNSVNKVLNIFESAPGRASDTDTLLGRQAISLAEPNSQYPIENLTVPILADTTVVSSIARQKVLDQKQAPVMSFYQRCRHQYSLVKAKYEYNRAYFAGVRQLSFNRDRYYVKHDEALYLETVGNNDNVLVNDFESQDGVWQA